MGLDWIVGARPAPGHEERGWALLQDALHTRAPAAIEAWHAVPTIDSWSVVGAPVVGEDAEATAWLIQRLRAAAGRDTGGAPTAEDHAALAPHLGRVLVELAPRCDGVPPYCNAAVNGELEFTSFRAQFLVDTLPWIGEDVWRQAHARMLPPALRGFTERLEALAATWAARTGLPEVAAAWAPPEGDPDSDPARLHILASAARWCRFWLDRGHWLEAWS